MSETTPVYAALAAEPGHEDIESARAYRPTAFEEIRRRAHAGAADDAGRERKDPDGGHRAG